MVVNNNDLIEEAMKRYGIEPDRLFNLKVNGVRFCVGFFAHAKDKKVTEVDEFFFTKIDGVYVFCDNYGRMKDIDRFSGEEIVRILFSNKDIEINYVDKPIERAKENNIKICMHVEKLYKKYIRLAKISSEDNTLDSRDFLGSVKKINDRNIILAKLDILTELLGYDTSDVKRDLESVNIK